LTQRKNKSGKNYVLGVQINSMSLPFNLINFRKSIIDDEKWILYDTLKEENYELTS